MAQGRAHQEEISYSSSSSPPDPDPDKAHPPDGPQEQISAAAHAAELRRAIVWHGVWHGVIVKYLPPDERDKALAQLEDLVLPTSDGEEGFAEFLDGLIAGFEESLELPRMATILEGARVRVVEAQARRERLVKMLVYFLSGGDWAIHGERVARAIVWFCSMGAVR